MKSPYIIDIVTEPLPREVLLARAPEFKAGANLKDPVKIAEDIDRKKKKYLEDAHLSEATAVVLAIAIADYDNPVDAEILTNETEGMLLKDFKAFLDKDKTGKIITFRGLKFVYPFLCRRGAANGLNFFRELAYPAAFQNSPLDYHIDIARIWACGSISHPDTLEEIANVLGIEYQEPQVPYHELIQTSEKEAFVQIFKRLEVMGKIGKAIGI